MTFTAQETKRATLELYEGDDLKDVTPDTTTDEVAFDRPRRPATRYFEAFGLYTGQVCKHVVTVVEGHHRPPRGQQSCRRRYRPPD